MGKQELPNKTGVEEPHKQLDARLVRQLIRIVDPIKTQLRTAPRDLELILERWVGVHVRHGDPRRVDAAPFEKINLLRSQRATGRVGKDRYTGPLVDDCRGFEHLALRIEHLVVAPADFADHPGSDTTISSTFEHVALHDLGELGDLGMVASRLAGTAARAIR